MKKDLYVYPAIIGKEKDEKEYSIFFLAISKNFNFSLTLQEALKEKLKLA